MPIPDRILERMGLTRKEFDDRQVKRRELREQKLKERQEAGAGKASVPIKK